MARVADRGVVAAVMASISQRAIDLIIREEVSSEALYRKRYTGPIWPGVASGVTVGIGYDVGYVTPARLRADWQGRIPDRMIIALSRACGVRGAAAKALAAELRGQVVIPWEAAISNFREVKMPRWIATVKNKLPNTDKLHPDCLGMLVSLAYNRGPSFDAPGDRYREMRAIKALMASGNFAGIPAQFRSMKRIWPHVKGLQDRREREARVFEDGLKKAIPRVSIPENLPKPEPEEVNSVDDPEDTKPAVKSKTIWASIIGVATSIGGVLADWRVALVIVGALFLFIAADRYLKLDIKGWFR
jgi:hypothetical protein